MCYSMSVYFHHTWYLRQPPLLPLSTSFSSLAKVTSHTTFVNQKSLSYLIGVSSCPLTHILLLFSLILHGLFFDTNNIFSTNNFTFYYFFHNIYRLWWIVACNSNVETCYIDMSLPLCSLSVKVRYSNKGISRESTCWRRMFTESGSGSKSIEISWLKVS